MAFNVLGNLGDPQKDVAAVTPLVDELEAKLVAGIQAAVKQGVDELGKVLGDTLAGFRVVVTFERIPQAKPK